jgi:hypothetical protein
MAPVVGPRRQSQSVFPAGGYRQKRLSEVPPGPAWRAQGRPPGATGARSASGLCRAASTSGTNMMSCIHLACTRLSPVQAIAATYRASAQGLGAPARVTTRCGRRASGRSPRRGCGLALPQMCLATGCYPACSGCCPGSRSSGGVQSLPRRAAIRERVRASSARRSAGRGKLSSP